MVGDGDFVFIDVPTVDLTSPEGPWDSSTAVVEWTYTQDQDYPQSRWEVQLQDSGGETVETRTGSGAGASVTLRTRLTEGEWTILARAASGKIWSDLDQSTIEVSFDPPATPTIEGAWDESAGVVHLSVLPGPDNGEPATVALVVERSVDGDVWELVSQVDQGLDLDDTGSPSYGDIQYRVTALTAEGAATVSATIIVEARSGALWLSGGPDFTATCRLPFNPTHDWAPSRQRALKEWAGRVVPVAVTGEMTYRAASVSGTTFDQALFDEETANVAALTELAQDPPTCSCSAPRMVCG